LEDFYDEAVLMVHGKGRKERHVIISESTRAAVTAWLPFGTKLLDKFKLEAQRYSSV
jgi:site-specific recombinase XerC